MDLNDIRSVVTVISFAVFVSIIIWAWRGARRDAFDAAARLPLVADEADTGAKS